MASSPITSWQIDGETVEIVTDFIFEGSKITADGDYRHKRTDPCMKDLCPTASWQIDGETIQTVTDFSRAPKSLQVVTTAMKLKDACSLEENL